MEETDCVFGVPTTRGMTRQLDSKHPCDRTARGSAFPGHIVAFMVFVGSVSLVFATSEVRADDQAVEEPYYFAVAGLVALDDFDSKISMTPLRVEKVDNTLGVSAWGGKRLHKRFSAELQFDWVKRFDLRLDQRHFSRPPRADLKAWLLTVNAKGYFPFGKIQPFCKVGAGVLHASLDTEEREHLADKTSDENFVLRFGGGVDLYATRNVSLTFSGEYVLPVGRLDEIPFVLIGFGIQRRF